MSSRCRGTTGTWTVEGRQLLEAALQQGPKGHTEGQRLQPHLPGDRGSAVTQRGRHPVL